MGQVAWLASEIGFIDVYAGSHMNHNTMKNMYQPIPALEVEKHKLGSVQFLLPGLATINTILRYKLSPKSRDDMMVRGYSIDLLHHLDELTSFNVMDLIVETSKRTMLIIGNHVSMLHIFSCSSTPKLVAT